METQQLAWHAASTAGFAAATPSHRVLQPFMQQRGRRVSVSESVRVLRFQPVTHHKPRGSSWIVALNDYIEGQVRECCRRALVVGGSTAAKS